MLATLRWWPALALLLALMLLALSLPSTARAAPLGQWVWSQADVAVLSEARALRPDVTAAVHVAEVRYTPAGLRNTLRLSPTTAPRAVAAVIRFDASFHAAWSKPTSDLELAALQTLQGIVALLQQTAPGVRILQLDYECPNRYLPRWASLLRALHASGTLIGYEVWITSVVSQLRAATFGPLFRGLIAGHIVQVFDTAEVVDERALRELTALLTRADLPFCVGVGAFERGRNRVRRTQHDAWWPAVGQLAQSPLFRGSWVSAAGQAWSERLGMLP